MTKLSAHPMSREAREMFKPAFRRYTCSCRAAGDVSPRRILKACAKFQKGKPASGRVERALFRVAAQAYGEWCDSFFYGGL